MGSLAGALHEVIVDEKDKKEKVAKRVFQLQDSKDPISSVYQHQASPGQRMVLMATSKRLYVFSGKGGLETMLARYTSPGTSIFVQSPFCLWSVLSVRRMAGAQTCKVFLSMNLTVLCNSLHHFLLCLTAVLLSRVVVVYWFVGSAAQSTSFSCQLGIFRILLVNQRHNQIADQCWHRIGHDLPEAGKQDMAC